MASIGAPVGRQGENRPRDVKTVQRLLNEHNLAPLRPLDVDGVAGTATVAAIEHFQSVHVGIKRPDGRVDPGGRTLRKLHDVHTAQRATGGGGRPDSLPSPPADGRARLKFVRPQVKELPLTARIIDAILPHFRGVRAVVISGYLSDTDLFWKVNYHWEYLLWMVEHSLTLEVEEKYARRLRAIRSALLSCRPEPDTGYRESPTVGRPQDRSTVAEFDRRHKILRGQKREFKSVFEAAGLADRSPRGARAFHLAAAPVAHPGTSKHSTGYALDIQGDNGQIKAICKRLGATLVFDEKSHVHVEFKNGVAGARR